MKDLIFLLVTLGLITFAMVFAQQRQRAEEAEKTRQWEQQRLNKPGSSRRPSYPPPYATPSPTPEPNR